LEKLIEIARIGTRPTAKTKRFLQHYLCRTATDMIHKLTWVHRWEADSVGSRER
jgi:hypothetical protein